MPGTCRADSPTLRCLGAESLALGKPRLEQVTDGLLVRSRGRLCKFTRVEHELPLNHRLECTGAQQSAQRGTWIIVVVIPELSGSC